MLNTVYCRTLMDWLTVLRFSITTVFMDMFSSDFWLLKFIVAI